MTLLAPETKTPHDRRATDLPRNVLVTEVEIRDPYNPNDVITAVQNIRYDPLGSLKASKIIDEAQYQAGRRWQRDYELSQLGGARGIDPTRTKVDGGGARDPISAQQMQASQNLKLAASELGKQGELIIRDILGQHMTFRSAARERELYSRRGREYIGKRFQECLETLAIFYGYAMKRA